MLHLYRVRLFHFLSTKNKEIDQKADFFLFVIVHLFFQHLPNVFYVFISFLWYHACLFKFIEIIKETLS